MKPIYIFLTFLLSFQLAQAADGHEIRIDIAEYDQDSLIVGYYFGSQTLVRDTLAKEDNGTFLLSGEEALESGVYLLLMRPGNQIVQFLVDDKDQHFNISFEANDLVNINFEGSEENELFNGYLEYLRESRANREPLVEKKKEEGLTEQMIQAIDDQIAALDSEVDAKQLSIINDYPNTVTSLMIKANRPIRLPEFEGTDEEIHNMKYEFYREHYFDNIEMANPISVRTPFFHERIDYYTKKLTYQNPDSINRTLDYILDAVKPAPKTYQYYLSQFINDYAQSNIVGQDAVYVYLAENYYGQGRAPWVEEENAKKIVEDALKLKPTLIGATAPQFEAYNRAGELIGLEDVDADYRVLFFWKPDCNHCTKAIPVVKEFYKNYKDKGVEIIAICTRLGKDYQRCWDGIKELNIGEFINLGDQYQRSQVLKKYNATQTPRFFIIDREDKIVMKGIGAEQLDDVMEELFKRAM